MVRKSILVLMILLVTAGLTACYKDAGENVQPTSNRVDLSDIQPTTSIPPTPIPSLTPTVELVETATRTLVPTITPFDAIEDAPPTETPAPTDVPAGEAPTATVALIPPSFTPVNTVAEPLIATPGISDIQSSPTRQPTVDPGMLPTPTAIPAEENKCIHTVQSGDTLYSIAQANAVLLTDLVAANPDLLGGSSATPLQIGWELRIPGCEMATEIPPESTTAPETGTPGPTAVPGTTITHVVQPGEYLYAIARQYGVDPQAIIAANNLTNPDRLSPGDVLIIPQ